MKTIISSSRKTTYFGSLSQENVIDKAFEVLKNNKFTFVNVCFQDESNAVYGVFLQRLTKGFIAILVVFLYGFSDNQDKGFVEEINQEYHFYNTKAELIINKDEWHLQLLGEQGNIQYKEASAPSFLIDSAWVSLKKVAGIEETSDSKAQLQVVLSNNGKATAQVEKVGDHGFKIIIRSDEQNISFIKGSNRLCVVEEVYGFGEMWNGHVAQRGQSFDIWDHVGTPDECAYMPYYVSTNNYAFFLNYGGRVSFDIGKGKADELVYSAPTNQFDIMLVSGNSIPAVVDNFLSETGKPPVPPRWSFKPWFWLMSDPDQPEATIETLKAKHLLEMVKRLKEMDIPVGATWFEPPWQTARTSFIPNPEFSSNLKEIIKELKEEGVSTLAWTVPYTAPTSPNWEDAVSNNYLAIKKDSVADYSNIKVSKSGEVEGTYYNYIDFFNPEAFNWWKDQINLAIELGFKGFKPDAGQTLQDDAVLYNGRLGKDVHNSYAKEYNRVFFDALSKSYGNDFLMVPRAAWVGSSALTNYKWPGDLRGSFANNGLPSSVYSSLSLAFCGIPFVSTDIGGFMDRPSPELVWIRWAQFGAMIPGMQTLHMPWWYSNGAADHFRFLALFHTELTPLWMTLAREAHETGTPVCRPLVWNYQDDVDCWRVDDQFIIGNQLLVAPIINPENNRRVYLPEGKWIDFWNNEKIFKGRQTIHWHADKNDGAFTFPLFIKEGAMIPLEVEKAITGFGWKESKGYLTMSVWPKLDGESEFTLKDKNRKVKFLCKSDKSRIEIVWDDKDSKYIFRIHLSKEIFPDEVSSNGEKLPQFVHVEDFKLSGSDGWYFDQGTGKLWVKKCSYEDPGLLRINISPRGDHIK